MQCKKHEALRYCIWLLSRKNYFSQELAGKLKRKGFSEEMIREALAYCQAHGFLNDKDLEERWIATQAKKLDGPLKIAAKLKSKGALSARSASLVHAIDQQASLKALLPKLRKKYDTKTLQGKRKLFQALVRRGFHIDEIWKVMSD